MTGSQSQKGAIAAPDRHYLPNCKQASLLTKTSWGPGRSTSAWEGVSVVHPENRVAGMQEVISHSVLTKHLITWAAYTWEGHKMQAQLSLHLWGLPECQNLSGLDLGGACSPGLASDGSRQSNLEPEQCGKGGHTCHEHGQAQCGWDTANTCQCYLFAASLPPHRATEQVSLKNVHHRPLVSGWKSDTEETSKQKKLKQRELPSKWQVQ